MKVPSKIHSVFLARVGVVATIITSLALTSPALAQDSPETRDEAVRDHVQALESSFNAPIDEVLADFEANRLAPSMIESSTPDARRETLARVQAAAEDAGGAFINLENDEYVLTLEGEKTYDIRFAVEQEAPYRIARLSVTEQERGPGIALNENNIAETFESLESSGAFSGVIHVRKDGKILHQGGYGLANPETGAPVRLDTIFGVGSRPIDFTLAGIWLLAEEGALSVDDRITEYFENVPADKRAITLRHLMTGQSGLPDFHGLPSDWDQDLAWIDRAEAERRIFAQELLFEPGTDRRHSHSAFGLLASVIERVSGEDYMAFLDEHFFTPAGMSRTGEYGDFGGHAESDFAVGGGPSFIGEPNIPPNWGKTSWLVKGSGGMYSTLADLLKFYEYVRTSGIVGPSGLEYFNRTLVQLDGSDRGFELFSISMNGGANEIYLFFNMEVGANPAFRDLTQALREMAREWGSED